MPFSSVESLSCLTLCDPTDCSTPGFLVHHQLPELAQTHAQRVGDAIQPSHPLLPTSPAFSFSQNQGPSQLVSIYSYKFLRTLTEATEKQLSLPLSKSISIRTKHLGKHRLCVILILSLSQSRSLRQTKHLGPTI